MEAQNRRADLEYRNALAELERFDRHGPGAAAAQGRAGQLPARAEGPEAPPDQA